MDSSRGVNCGMVGGVLRPGNKRVSEQNALPVEKKEPYFSAPVLNGSDSKYIPRTQCISKSTSRGQNTFRRINITRSRNVNLSFSVDEGSKATGGA